METTTITIIIVVGLAVYFAAMWLIMRWTFNYHKSLNYYVFKNSLEKPKIDLMHYLELAISILMMFAIVTSLISTMQIYLEKRKSND